MSFDKKEFLTQLSKELHKPVVRKMKRVKVLTKGLDDVWAADLVEMGTLSKDNDGYKYMLNVIDVFSRKAWAIPLKSKDGDSVLNAFKKIVMESKRKPNKLWTDQGKEFLNAKMRKWLETNKIIIYHTYGEHKASTVERFNRTLKTLMWKRFTEEQTHRWVDMLDELIDKYNNTIHSALKMTPDEASDPKNERSQLLHQYGKPEEHQGEPTPKDNNLNLRDWVRVSKVKRTFEKGYTPNWSNEVFQIYEKRFTNPLTYRLMDYEGKEINGSFYAQELQRTKLNDVFLVDEVKKTRTVNGEKQSLVSWVGYPKGHETWIKDSDIQDIKSDN